VFAWAENQVLVCVKSVPLGQVAGQRLLLSLRLDIERAAALARVVDTRSGRSFGTMQITNRVTNNADARRGIRIWAQALRLTHERAVAIMQNSPDTALQLADDGTLSIDLGVVVDRVKTVLAERGVGFADLIPEIDKSVPLAQTDSLILIRTVYQIAVAAGFWLPWVVLGLVVAGILLARNHLRALFWTSIAFAAAFLLLAGGVGVGRTFFIGAVSPSIMTGAAAQSLFDQVTSLLSPAIAALALLGVLIAVWACSLDRIAAP